MLVLIILAAITRAEPAKPVACVATGTYLYLQWPNTRHNLFMYGSFMGRAPGDNKTIPNPCESVTESQIMSELNIHERAPDRSNYVVDRVYHPRGLYRTCKQLIRGNVVVADWKWVYAVDKLCDHYGHRERARVYGDDIMEAAETAVKRCCSASG